MLQPLLLKQTELYDVITVLSLKRAHSIQNILALMILKTCMAKFTTEL